MLDLVIVLIIIFLLGLLFLFISNNMIQKNDNQLIEIINNNKINRNNTILRMLKNMKDDRLQEAINEAKLYKKRINVLKDEQRNMKNKLEQKDRELSEKQSEQTQSSQILPTYWQDYTISYPTWRYYPRRRFYYPRRHHFRHHRH